MRLKFNILLIVIFYANLTQAFSLTKTVSRWWQNKKQQIEQNYNVNDNITVIIENLEGDVNIKVDPNNILNLDIKKYGTNDEVVNTKVDINVDKEKAEIKTVASENSAFANTSYDITVPSKAIIIVRIAESGNIKITGSDNLILEDIYTNNGQINIDNSYNKVTAKTTKGVIKLNQVKLNKTNSILLESLESDIYLTLPKNIVADLQARTVKGLINSEHKITLYPLTLKLNKVERNRIKKDIKGILNSNDISISGEIPNIVLETMRGNIYINEQKI